MYHCSECIPVSNAQVSKNDHLEIAQFKATLHYPCVAKVSLSRHTHTLCSYCKQIKTVNWNVVSEAHWNSQPRKRYVCKRCELHQRRSYSSYDYDD